MRKYGWLSLLLAALLLLVLTASVMAQNTVIDEEPVPSTLSPTVVQLQPVTTTLRQQLPVSVTLLIPLGPTETQTVTVPMLLSLNLQLGFGELITTSVALTAEIDGLAPITTPVTTSLTTPLTPSISASTATPFPATFTPTPLPATPTTLPATATPLPTATPALTTTEPLTATESVTTAAPITATEIETDSATSEEADTLVLVPECSDPRSTIVFPGVNQVLNGTVDVIGSANHENFSYFKLEYANGADASPAAEYFYLGGSNNQVENGLLATIDTQSLLNGIYTMRLTVVDNTGNFPAPCSVTVEVAN